VRVEDPVGRSADVLNRLHRTHLQSARNTGGAVPTKFTAAWQTAAVDPRPLAVVDIDGVVADVRHRLHFIEGKPRQWDRFFAAADQDPPLPQGVALVKELAADHDVVWLTGRPERTRRATRTWLAAQGLPTESLIMRPNRDFRPARLGLSRNRIPAKTTSPHSTATMKKSSANPSQVCRPTTGIAKSRANSAP